MPKNKGKGGKNRRRGKNENESEKRELIFKEDEQEYAQVTKMLGNGRLEAMCFDGVKRLCHIRGKLRKKVKICAKNINFAFSAAIFVFFRAKKRLSHFAKLQYGHRENTSQGPIIKTEFALHWFLVNEVSFKAK